MATTTTYTCDRCHSTAIDDKNFLFRVELTARDISSKLLQADWCHACLVQYGFLGPTKSERDAGIVLPAAPPTLEQILAEWISDRVDERLDERGSE